MRRRGNFGESGQLRSPNNPKLAWLTRDASSASRRPLHTRPYQPRTLPRPRSTPTSSSTSDSPRNGLSHRCKALGVRTLSSQSFKGFGSSRRSQEGTLGNSDQGTSSGHSPHSRRRLGGVGVRPERTGRERVRRRYVPVLPKTAVTSDRFSSSRRVRYSLSLQLAIPNRRTSLHSMASLCSLCHRRTVLTWFPFFLLLSAPLRFLQSPEVTFMTSGGFKAPVHPHCYGNGHICASVLGSGALLLPLPPATSS